MDRPLCITYNMASIDGRLTIAPDVNLMVGDERWTAITAALGDPYEWVRTAHDPQVLLEGSGPDFQRHAGQNRDLSRPSQRLRALRSSATAG